MAWFVLGYAFYASIFAVAASLVSRQEDLGTVITPTTMSAGRRASSSPSRRRPTPAGTLATVTSFIPGLSPLVMPVRQAAGDAALWEVAAGRRRSCSRRSRWSSGSAAAIYAGALLRTSGKTKMREALGAERA